MLEQRRPYPSDLTDEQWEYIKKLVPDPKSGGRPRKTHIREIINAIFYLNRTGCAWRYLPREFPPWQTVYGYFARFSASGIWRELSLKLHEHQRDLDQKRSVDPSYAVVDSQSVRAQYGEERGYDGFKKIRGRKRHILVDSMGIVYAAKVSAADKRDQREGLDLIAQTSFRELKAIYADGAYRGLFEDHAYFKYGLIPTLIIGSVQRKDKSREGREIKQSNLKPKRWIVERTFAWFNNFRRLSRDYERRTRHSESLIFVCMIMIMLHRLAPP